MKHKLIYLLLVTVLVFVLAACGKDDEKEKTPDRTDETENATKTPTPTPSPEPTRTPDGPVDSDKFVDFTDMSFFYNGKKYILGKATLRDLVNDGVEITTVDKLEDTVEAKSWYSRGFSIQLAPYRSATMTVGNFTDLEQKVGDCVICSIRVDSIPKLPEGAIGFIFPDLFMKEDLLRCAGEPTKTNSFTLDNGVVTDILTYAEDSELYMAERSFAFTFRDGLIYEISLSYVD